MSFLAALRTRLAEPVAACVQAAKAAAEHAMTRLAPATPGDADTGVDLPPPMPARRARVAAAVPPAAVPLSAVPLTAVQPAAVPPAAVAPDNDPLDEAQMHLARLAVALASSGDPAVAAAGAQFHSAVRALIEALSRDPTQLPAHAHPLAAWVPGLAAATERFVSLQREKPCPDRRAELVTVLDQVARRVQAHTRAVEGLQATTQAA